MTLRVAARVLVVGFGFYCLGIGPGSCAAVGGNDLVILGNPPDANLDLGSWGPNSSASISTNGEMKLVLDGGVKFAGAFLQISQRLDMSRDVDRLLLSMDVRGERGGESISVFLRDGSISNGMSGFQVEANQPENFLMTTGWQRLVMPLTDFPRTGENWTIPVPPGVQPPLKQKIDWANINGFGVSKWGGRITIFLKNITVSTNPAHGPSELLQPVTVPASVDLSHGKPLELVAGFSAPTWWKVSFSQEKATRTFSGIGNFARVKWDGGADSGAFVAGKCSMTLSYGDGLRSSRTEKFRLSGPHSPRVQVAQAGYEPSREKSGRVMGEKTSRPFRVVNADTGRTALSGSTPVPGWCKQAGDWCSVVDFSMLRKPGEYYLEVKDVGRSFCFKVGEGLYDSLLRASMKSYFFQRCGMDLEPQFAGNYSRKACHLQDAVLYAGCSNDVVLEGPRWNSTGGWHDAGDYGKKIVAAADALGYLLAACEMFEGRVKTVRLGIPGDASEPDMLREIQYELDWMLTMQDADGGVHALITTQDFYLIGMPDGDRQPRYIVGVSTCATADFAAVMAQASRVFKPWNREYAGRCLEAARRAWGFLEQHPEIVPAGGYHDPPGIHNTGTYDDGDDRDNRFRAACELFVSTGEAVYNKYVRERCEGFGYEPPGYMHVQGFGMVSYSRCPGADKDLAGRFRSQILAYATNAAEAIERSPYGIGVEANPDWWNNWTALQTSASLIVAFELNPDQRFLRAAVRQFEYGLGCNPVDTCYITGFGSRPVKDPWQPACYFDGIPDPIPGFVVTGANLISWDLPMQRYQEIHHLAPLKTYVDDHRAASVNEVCLNFNGPFVFVTAFLSGLREN